MQNWVKFVVRTTLVSGGLLMVGPGVASATEKVDPDVPASLVDQQVVTPAVVVAGDSLREAKPLQQLETGGRRALQPVAGTVDGTPGVATPAGPVHPAQVASLRAKPLPVGEVTEDLLDPDLEETPLVAGDDLQTPSLPLSGTVITDPLDPAAGTRVTAVNADAPELGNTHNVRGRSDTPRSAGPEQDSASVIPLADALSAPNASTLPVDMPVSGHLPTVESLATVVPEVPALTPLDTALVSPETELSGLTAVEKLTSSLETPAHQ